MRFSVLKLFFLNKTEEITSEEAALSRNGCDKTGNSCGNQEFLKVQSHASQCAISLQSEHSHPL